MISLITTSKAQRKIVENMRALRLKKGLTQGGLAERSGVSLPTLRKFEQKGLISLESFLKLTMSLGCLENLVAATSSTEGKYSSIEDVLKDRKDRRPQRGWRK